MKYIPILTICLLLSGCIGQKKNVDNYIVYFEQPNSAKVYKMGSHSYLDYYLSDKVKFGDKNYFVSNRIYSWGKRDTSYFRDDEKNYYSFDPQTNLESVVLPKEVTVGQKWLEADSSWSYKIIGIDKRLITPAKKYKELIVIECIQLTNRDKAKSKEYHLYYAKGIGMVGSVNNGKLTSYLSEIKKNAKDGEQTGN